MWPFIAKSNFAIGFAIVLNLPISQALSVPQRATSPFNLREVFQFAEDVWIENLAVRSNGALLLTTISPNGSVYEIANPTTANPTVSLVYTLPGASGLFGITEATPDVFVVAAAQYSSGGGFVANTTSSFSLDFNHVDGPVARKITAMPEVGGPNGVTTLPHDCPIVLIADSVSGEVWQLDPKNGDYSVAIKAQQMDPVLGNPWAYIGINGVHFSKGSVYFTNFDTATLYRTKLNPNKCKSASTPVETLFVASDTLAAGFDDFAIGPDSTFYLATNVNNSIIAVTPDGKGGIASGIVAAQNDTLLAGDTAGAFGKTKEDQDILYIVTSYGKVAALDTTGH